MGCFSAKAIEDGWAVLAKLGYVDPPSAVFSNGWQQVLEMKGAEDALSFHAYESALGELLAEACDSVQSTIYETREKKLWAAARYAEDPNNSILWKEEKEIAQRIFAALQPEAGKKSIQ